MAGKTGTSQVFSLDGGEYDEDELKERMKDHGLFIAFAPAGDPKIAVSVLVENGAAAAAQPLRWHVRSWTPGSTGSPRS